MEAYQPTTCEAQQDLVRFLTSLYGSNSNFDFFLSEYQKAYDYCCTSTHITFLPLAYCSEGRMLAHVALIIDDRLPEHEAFFGFFEVVDDRQVFETLWEALTAIARTHGCRLLKGPVQGSIWHQYRCIAESSSVPFVKTEPMTPSYYYDFLLDAQPTKEITYSSGIRESFTDIRNALQKQKDTITEQLSAGGFAIEITREVSMETLVAIAGLSATVFDEKSWGYTKLDTAEFLQLYDLEKVQALLHKLFLLRHGDTLVGYCSTMKEGNTFICKTICIASPYQGKGLGTALALAIHEEAAKEGAQAIMYVLVRDGNQVHNYHTSDVKIFRTYAVFEYTLNA